MYITTLKWRISVHQRHNKNMKRQSITEGDNHHIVHNKQGFNIQNIKEPQ